MHDTKLHEITGTIESWHYDALFRVVMGYVYGDTKGRFPDGTHIHTSSIVSPTRWSALKEGDIIRTLNSTYKLGKPFDVRSPK